MGHRHASVWDNSFSVGLEEIDEDHHRLFRCLDEVIYALNTSFREAQCFDALAQLEDYANTHFRTEECLMRLLNYPGFAAHKREHETFIAKIDELRSRIQEEDISRMLAAFLTTWLLSHIRRSDTAYVEFFRARVSPEIQCQ